MDRKIYKFGDRTLVSVLKMMQLAFLTQTDVTDNFRYIRLEENPDEPGALEPTAEFNEWFSKAIEKQLEFCQNFEEESKTKDSSK